MNSRFKLILNVIFFLLPLMMLAQDEPKYKQWDSEDVKSLYSEVDNEDDADEIFDDRFFEKRHLEGDVYEIEVIEKVDTKFWKIRGANLFLYFRRNPYLYKYDEGILEWDGRDGVFYKKP